MQRKYVLPIGLVILVAFFLLWRRSGGTVTPQLPSGSEAQIATGIAKAEKNTDLPPPVAVAAAIVPHHLTAAETIATGIRSLSGERNRTIVLVSPDHFGACPQELCTTDASFRTPFGTVPSDSGTFRALRRGAARQTSLFVKEHGIGAVMPFIAKLLPGARVVPLVVSQKNNWASSRERLADLLLPLARNGVTIVVSSDFSHYLPLAAADAKDAATAATFLAGDLDGIAKLENPSQSDCPACLWALAKTAKERGFFNPSVLLHTNSARILSEPHARETTSHFAVAFYRNAELSGSDPAFGGDVTFTRGVPARGKLPTDLATFWKGKGLRMLNLEGPLAAHCEADKDPFIFCNSLEQWEQVRGLATHWGIENNHALDQGLEGRDATVLLLRHADVTPVSVTEPALAGNVRMYAATGLLNPVKDAPKGFAYRQIQDTLAAVERLHDDRALDVVFVHAGHTEYGALMDESDRAMLRRFIDAGADAVIAAHTHVPGDMEIYRGKPIFRGVGNFLFDQWADAVTRTSKAVRLRKDGDSVLFETLVAEHTR